MDAMQLILGLISKGRFKDVTAINFQLSELVISTACSGIRPLSTVITLFQTEYLFPLIINTVM